jgi:hypothetical protein
MVTLWTEGPAAPKKLSETQTDANGRYNLCVEGNGKNEIFYVMAVSQWRGKQRHHCSDDHPGDVSPAHAVVNELTIPRSGQQRILRRAMGAGQLPSTVGDAA